ncbi:hypothetical protein D3C84_616540 [compost metagenome]
MRPRPDRRWSWPAGAAARPDVPERRRLAGLRAADARKRRPPPGDAPPATGAGLPCPCPPARHAATGRPAGSGLPVRRCTVQAVHRHRRLGAATVHRRCSIARLVPVARHHRPDANAGAMRHDVPATPPAPVAGSRCPVARAAPAIPTGSSDDEPRCVVRRTSAGSASATRHRAPAPDR